MRGKPIDVWRDNLKLGLIPAYAGKTARPGYRLTWPRAHPRVCGENMLVHWPSRTRLGSSPRMRGKRDGTFSISLDGGLIPAYAGKTEGLSGLVVAMRAHPRVCGENIRRLPGVEIVDGSSPRMRGKPSGVFRRRGLRGLIPAYAGKTRLSFAGDTL